MTREQPKRATPKPMEAWACGCWRQAINVGLFDEDGSWREYIEAHGMNWRAFRVRVRIVPITKKPRRAKK